MSASSFIAIYGIRLELNEDDLDAMEDRTHSFVVNAKKAGLDHFWGNFGCPGELHLIFIGRMLGVFGAEGDQAVRIEYAQLEQIADDVSSRLRGTGLSGKPALLLQYQPD